MSFWGKLFGSKQNAAEMDLKQFAAVFSKRIRSLYPGTAPRLEMGDDPVASRIVWVHPDGLEMFRFLGNAFQAYRQQPDQLSQIVDAQLAAINDIVTASRRTPEQRRACILPLIKTQSWVDASLRQLRTTPATNDSRSDKAMPFVVKPLVGDLIVTYVEDRPDSMRFLAASDVDALSILPDTLHVLALNNLFGLLPQLRIAGGGGRFAARLDQSCNASMVLLFEGWRDRIDVIGDPVIAIPARDELLLCGSRDDEAVRSLTETANNIFAQSPYALSRELFTWRDGALMPFAG